MQIIDCIILITHQKLWGYKIEEKLIWGHTNKKRLHITALKYQTLDEVQ
jgi:hypothetical protein